VSRDEQLDLFVRRTEELIATRLVRSGSLRASLNLRAAQNQPVQLTTHAPDEDDLRSFLLTFRQFTLQNEPVHAPSIHNNLWRRLTGDGVREQLAAARQRYGDAMKTGGLALVLNEHPFSPTEVLDLWINGRYFHNDSRKAKTLDQLDPMSTVFVRHAFLDVLVEATKYVLFLANVIVIVRREGLL
jgi:hypothetical protein